LHAITQHRSSRAILAKPGAKDNAHTGRLYFVNGKCARKGVHPHHKPWGEQTKNGEKTQHKREAPNPSKYFFQHNQTCSKFPAILSNPSNSNPKPVPV